MCHSVISGTMPDTTVNSGDGDAEPDGEVVRADPAPGGRGLLGWRLRVGVRRHSKEDVNAQSGRDPVGRTLSVYRTVGVRVPLT